MINFGKVRPGSTLEIWFDSFAAATGAPSTISGFATSDIKVYKNANTTFRASTSGYTLLDTDGIDINSITGINGFSIDLSDNTTADFWASGARYTVVVSTITVDSQTVSFVAARFTIGESASILDTTIATLAGQTGFTLTAGPADNNALRGCIAVIHDAASAVQCAIGVVSSYVGSTKTVTLQTDPGIFTMAAKDNISFIPDLAHKLGTPVNGTFGQDVQDVENLIGNPAQTTAMSDYFTTVLARIGSPASDLNTLLVTLATYVDTEVAAIKAKTDNLPSSPAAVGSAMTLTSGERDNISAALLDLAAGVETGLTLRQAMRGFVAALLSKCDGGAGTTMHYRDFADTKNRLTATVDADGNRTGMSRDLT